MLGNKKTFKAQSAMEYLMTYGWAILIIAVVLGALFSLGVFSGSSLLGTSCVASPGYLCQSPTLLTGAVLTFTFGQNIGSPIYNVEMACGATASSTGLPSNSLSWAIINGVNGYTWAMSGNTATATNAYLLATALQMNLVSGQTQVVTGLQCYSPTGLPLTATTAPIGSSYTGFVWVNYTSSACTSVPCTWYTVKAATLTMKVV